MLERGPYDIALLLLSQGVLEIGQQFTLRSGDTSNYYINLRKSEISDKLMERVVEEIKKLAFDMESRYVVGVPNAGVGFARSFAESTKRTFVCFDKYGRLLEGTPFLSREIVVIENVTNSGASTTDFVHMLRDKGLVIRNVIILVNRGGNSVLSRLAGCDLTPHVVLDIKDAFDTYLRDQRISPEQYDELIG